MQFYNSYFFKYGIRKSAHLTSPPLPSIEFMDLPKESIFHFIPDSSLVIGPPSDEYLFRNITRQIMMSHITENGDTRGTPRHLTVAVNSLIKNYHNKNRRYRLMHSLESSVRDPSTLVVYNYGFIPNMYRYMRSFYSDYYKWWNIQAAVWKNIAAVSKECHRQQFLICGLPQILPSVSNLNQGSVGINQKTVKLFNSHESMFLLEIWKWLGEDRKSSVLSNVPVENMDKVNILFQESGRWFVLNLGLINKWRVATKEELEINPEANTKGILPVQLQRRFLRLAMSLFQVRTVPVENATKATATTTVVTQVVGTPELNKETGIVETKIQTQELPEETNETNDKTDTGDDVTHDDDLDKRLNEELSELEVISNNHFGDTDISDEANEIIDVVKDNEPEPIPILKPAPLEDGIKRVCDKLANIGMMSAAEHKKFSELAVSYKTLIAPDKQSTLEQFIVVKPESVLIESSPKIVDTNTIVDKTMLSSSLHVFDRKYIKDVMQKDIVGSVMAIQNAGIAVTKYDVEHFNTVMGAYDEHTVKITPVTGAASTLKFRIPSVNEDGTYVSNSVKFSLRKMRGDNPIRKIAPDKVALTSYYGKVFVNRSSKKVNDYGHWIRNSIMVRGLDKENTIITNLQPNNVFDNRFKCPRLYSVIATGFRGFTISPIHNSETNGLLSFDLSFDHTKREHLYGADVLAKFEKNGSLVIGVGLSENARYLVMDKNSAIYYTDAADTLHELGEIEELLDLEIEKAPIDFAELKVLGKAIPIGIILGYELGLDKLIKILGVNPRRVQAGSRVNLESHEYAIVFSDETLVFNKDSKEATIILAGFNEYHKTIRQYSVYEFDKPGVYLNVLENAGITVRYLRELDLLNQMFIDPITMELLVEMKEPTDFRGLLRRSCQLLLLDQHPDELDPAHMRIKGYERMSGAVYGELVRSIRAHNSFNGRSKTAIDLNPFAVWKSIMQDPSAAIVSDINPVNNLKEMEAVTFNGVGGRNSRSMTKHTRAYHENDMGIMSESTVDSGDVGINTYLCADPQFTSVRGMARKYKVGETGVTALLSTSALLAPGSDQDD